jgi:hypothetical protein
MWKGLGALLAKNPAKRGMMSVVASVLSVEDAEKVIKDMFPKLATMGKVESVANGVLVIQATNNIAMQELTLRKTPLMRALKERGIDARDIRIRMHFEKPEGFQNT